jgi:hypothetical protein
MYDRESGFSKTVAARTVVEVVAAGGPASFLTECGKRGHADAPTEPD